MFEKFSKQKIDFRYGLVLPLISLGFIVSVVLFFPHWGKEYLNANELGLVENAQVVWLIGAIYFGCRILFGGHRKPYPFINLWVLALTIGCIYIAGEEISWGQHYFAWKTPEWIARVNTQGETNLHNTSAWFNNIPLQLLEGSMLIGGVFYPLLAKWKGRSNPSKLSYWLWPTFACFPTALIAQGIQLFRAFKAGKHLIRWLPLGELKEYYLYLFILIYVGSIYARLAEQESQIPRSDADLEAVKSSADPIAR